MIICQGNRFCGKWFKVRTVYLRGKLSWGGMSNIGQLATA